MSSTPSNTEKILKVISQQVRFLAMKLAELESKKRLLHSQEKQLDHEIRWIQSRMMRATQSFHSRGNLVVMQSLHVGRNECERLSEQIQLLAQQQTELDLKLQRMKRQYQNEYSREQAIQKLLEQRKNKQRRERLKQEQHQLDELAAVRDRNLSGT